MGKGAGSPLGNGEVPAHAAGGDRVGGPDSVCEQAVELHRAPLAVVTPSELRSGRIHPRTGRPRRAGAEAASLTCTAQVRATAQRRR